MAEINKHHNFDYDTTYPKAIGDNYFAQDLLRDFNYNRHKSGQAIKNLFEDFPILLEDSNITNGTSFHEIDIPVSKGYCYFSIEIPNDISSRPGTKMNADIILYVESSQLIDFDIQSSAILDGATTNYIKLRYKSSDGTSRTRQHSSGSYAYEKLDDYEIIVDTVSPTDYDIVLGTCVGDDSTFLTITNYKKTIFKYKEKMEIISSNQTLEVNKRYFVYGNIELNLPSSANQGDVIEIFTKDESRILQTDSEHIMEYLTKYYTTKGSSGYLQLHYGDSIKLIYDGSGDIPLEPSVRLSDPAILPAGYSDECSMTYDGTYLAISHQNSPYITIYKRSGDTFTKLSDPGTLPGSNGTAVAISWDGVYLMVGTSSSPYITIYKRSGDTFTKLSDPGTLPTNTVYGGAFSPDTVYLAVCHTGSPRVTIYKRSGDTFTKLSDPGTLPTGDCWGASWSGDGNYLALAHSVSPFITVYKREGDTFIKLDNPSTLPAGAGRSCAFSYSGKLLAVSSSSSKYLIVYNRNGDKLEALTYPSTDPPSNGSGLSFAYNDRYLFVSGNVSSPYMIVYKIKGSAFIPLSNPATIPTGGCHESSVSRDGKYICFPQSTSPYINIYKQYETITKKWIIKELNTLHDGGYLFESFH